MKLAKSGVSVWRWYAATQIRISYFLSTVATIVKYWPFLDVGRGAYFQKGVVIKPYLWRAGRLKISLHGNNVIGNGTIFQGAGTIEFGERSFCASRCIFAANDRIRIGKNVMIADHVTIRDTDHGTSDLDIPMIDQPIVTRSIVVEDDVWIGHGAIVLKGVTIGSRSVIAAGSVVTCSVPRDVVVGGVPARVLRDRKVRGG